MDNTLINISTIVDIHEKGITLNEQEVYAGNVANNLKDAYKQLEINYPRFYKMDTSCKLGIIASELLLKRSGLTEKYPADEIAIVLGNKSASLETDKHYFETIREPSNYFPSPALFVYTLPNIVMGEISIRHNITGENAFFISEEYSGNDLLQYFLNLQALGKASAAIAGWLEYFENSFRVLLFTVELNGAQPPGEAVLQLASMFNKHNDGNTDRKPQNGDH